MQIITNAELKEIIFRSDESTMVNMFMPDTLKYYSVYFDDKQLMLTNRQILLSWYYWSYYRINTNIPINSSLSVCSMYVKSSHIDLCNRINIHILFHYKTPRDVIWSLASHFYIVNNSIYNFIALRLPEFVTSLSILDFLEISDNPELVEAKEHYNSVAKATNYNEPSMVQALDNTNKVLTDILTRNDGTYEYNALKQLCLDGVVRLAQVQHILGHRGYPRDISGGIFKLPVDEGYLEGMSDTYDVVTDSRTYSRSLLMNTSALQNTEWFNRELQLAASFIRSIDYRTESCIGYNTVPWHVESGHGTLLRGKYHMVDGKPVLITNDLSEISGKIIHLRSIMGCNSENVQKVCPTCLGWVSNIMRPNFSPKEKVYHENANIGYDLVSTLGDKITSIIFSTKHYESSATFNKIELDRTLSQWFSINPKETHFLYMALNKLNCRIQFKIEQKYVSNISHINQTDIDILHLKELSNVPVMYVSVVDSDNNLLTPYEMLKIDINGNKGVYISKDVLEYIKLNGWSVEKKHLVFTLANWSHDKPVFVIPKIDNNVITFLENTRTFIKPKGNEGDTIIKYNTSAAALRRLVEILEDKVEINITQAEIILRALMTVDPHNNNWKMPRSNEQWIFSNLLNVLLNRSFAIMTATQEQHTYLLNPKWQEPYPYSDHPMEPILALSLKKAI